MKAAVIRTVSGPEVLRIESRQVPEPTHEQVLIRVKAFGLNRSALFTRRGLSPGLSFPRVLGIEAAGWLGMTVEQLEVNYGHYHPDFQGEAAEAFSGRR
jgi:NADPH:quinone reductase-like Zn-dependent oxidoreductase